jgi:hypothetical protein
VEPDDSQVPAPRQPALPLFRRPAPGTGSPTDLPGEPETPRVPDLSELLADIDALRLTLQTDLTLAAAALEAGADQLAGELVDGDLSEVRAFSARADRHLAALADDDAPAAPAEEPEVVPLRPRRRVLAAAPLVVAAAALLGFVAGVVPERVTEQPPSTMTSATLASYELNRLVSEGATDEQLRRVAEELNDELAALVAQAANDPVAAQQAMSLLQQTTAVLASQGDSNVLRGVMAEARMLRERLREALPAVAQPARPGRPVVRPVVPVLPREPEPEQRRETTKKSEPQSTPKASPAPKPSPSTAPAPAAPEPEQSSEPRPSGSPRPGLPGPGDLPGV